MNNNSENFIDENSGISVEEQKEILTRINGIAETNRLSLSHGEEGGKRTIKAKKSGARFPLSVNITALVIFAGGAFLLILFNMRIDAQVRTGSAVYNFTERALIEEIRRDTDEKIAAKDREISSIVFMLDEVDARLLRLQSEYDITSEQAEALETLLKLQTSYKDEISVLQRDRSLILEESRSKEAVLRARLDERSQEFNALRTTAGHDSAAGEFELLSGEQEKIAAAEAHFAGSFAVITDLIQNGQYDQALLALENLRGFNNSSSFSMSRSFQSRKEFYNQTINSTEAMVKDMQYIYIVNSAGLALNTRNARLEEENAELRGTIDALNSGSEGQARIYNELQETIASLEAGNAEKDRTISSQRTANSEQAARIAELQTANAQQTTRIADLQTANAQQTARTAEFQTANTQQTARIAELQTANAQQTARITELNQITDDLRARNLQQEHEIANLKNQIETIRQLLN